MSSKRNRKKTKRIQKEWKLKSENGKDQKKEFDFIAGQMIYF
jgi:hypothetical protein